MVLGLYQLTRAKSLTPLQRLFLLLPPAVLFVAYSIWSDDAGIRYLIPVLPFLYLVGGLGLVMLARNRALFARGLAALFLLPVDNRGSCRDLSGSPVIFQ